MILEILKEPDPRLRKISKPVEKVDDSIRKLLSDMLETMYDDNGAGLAAPQVGTLLRMIVVDVSYKEGHPQEILKMVNPEITYKSEDEITYNEGCLSVPQGFAELTRPKIIKVRYLDEFAISQEKTFDEWAARAVLHEVDHLNGILFIDHLSRLKPGRLPA